jgi:hypothetical protein
MAASIFSDKSVTPDNKKLSDGLGKSYMLWEELLKTLREEHGKLTEEWKYYGQKIGWTLKLFYKKRNLFFFTPCDKYFRLSFVFGDKAVSEIEKSSLPKNIINELLSARKYAEGRGLRIEVRKKSNLKSIKRLVEIKIKN